MSDKKVEIKKTEDIQKEPIKFKGRFIFAIGRRKTAVAQVRIYKNGSGVIIVNNQKVDQYFPSKELFSIVFQCLKLTGLTDDLDVSVITAGGGKKAQAEATRHGMARALEILNKDLRPSLKAKNWLTRDSRKKERKKPGLKKARRAPQWSKR
ncbi:MAG: 30S ribosomal protein S9 [Patescibacteria group bacterium]|nr:30S ribosomal protein S9 [Patescibacteria group bacterium]MBU1870642.1 30S ribosomal protein S9 [Patescibacteria group bacterium]